MQSQNTSSLASKLCVCHTDVFGSVSSVHQASGPYWKIFYLSSSWYGPSKAWGSCQKGRGQYSTRNSQKSIKSWFQGLMYDPELVRVNKGFIIWISIYYGSLLIFVREQIVQENLAQLLVCIFTVALHPNKLFSYQNDVLFSRKHQYLTNLQVSWFDLAPLPSQLSANSSLAF